MSPKRISRDDDSLTPDGPGVPILTAETLRSAANNDSEVQLHQAVAETRPAEEKVSVFWRIFGGTILSIVALVIISAYQSVTSTLKDLNGEINQLKEAKADFVKKDEWTTSRTKIWERMQKDEAEQAQQTQTVTTLKGDMTRSDEMIRAEQARLGEALKALLTEKREIQTATQTAVGQMKDRQTTFEQQLRSAEQALRAVEQQLKTVEQFSKDIQAANVAVSALQAGAVSREAHAKVAEEQRAELTKAVAEMRERLTRLEVSFQTKPPAASSPTAKPAAKKPVVPAKAEEEDPDGR